MLTGPMAGWVSARNAALAVLAIAGATLVGAWIAQALGIAPCELCLKQRYAYYAGVPLALGAFLSADVNRRAARFLLVLLALVFAANVALAIYHSGVEFKFWPGPEGCSGGYKNAGSMADFMKELQSTRVVRCDEVSLRILGFSLANANVLISGAVAAIAAFGAGLAKPLR